ncbi:MAG TPA: SDR family NAD(P)-dependent oxidoreductase, partial [Candidatus Binatia bacterium]|nr:SDR family NAD(P)-dependent oxidoreductase [Candidatus Binatia bacterium]
MLPLPSRTLCHTSSKVLRPARSATLRAVLTPLENRVAVVTGGSRGIGRGIATALARHGARVLIAARG